jgi:hypothetical protein
MQFMSDDDVDPVDEINYALWGEIDERTRRAAQRMRDAGDAAADRDVAAHQHLRDVLGRIEASRTPPELKSWLLRTVAERRAPEPPEMDVSWLAALPTATPVSLRSCGPAVRVLSCAWEGGELRAQVQTTDRGAACGIVGRVVDRSRRPVQGRPIALFVDRAPVESAVTDSFGEFEFDARRGAAFGVRVGDGDDAVHVSLVEPVAGKDESGPSD